MNPKYMNPAKTAATGNVNIQNIVIRWYEMRKWIKGILYGNLYFGIVSTTVCILMITFAYGIYLDNLPLMIGSSFPIVMITLFQSMAIRDLIYKKYENLLERW